jgi:hypothetical protein
LDNLEKDVSHSDVIKVMSTMACGIVQVYIFPCLKFEKFTRGYVWFKDHTSLMKAYALLQDDNFFIVSSSGRYVILNSTYHEWLLPVFKRLFVLRLFKTNWSWC